MIKTIHQAKSTAEKGRWGEDLASRYLSKKNYHIIRRNYFIRGGEIDLIAEKDGIIVFVEVKLRSGGKFGTGEEALTKAKKQKLLRTIFSFLQSRARAREGNISSWRLDLIDIRYTAATNRAYVRHLHNILEA